MSDAVLGSARTPTPWGPSLEAFQHVLRLHALTRFERLVRSKAISYIGAMCAMMTPPDVDLALLTRHESARAVDFAAVAEAAAEFERGTSPAAFWSAVMDSAHRFRHVARYLEAAGRDVACRGNQLDYAQIDGVEARAVLAGGRIPRYEQHPFCAFGFVAPMEELGGCHVLRPLTDDAFYVVEAFVDSHRADAGIVYKTTSTTSFIALPADDMNSAALRGSLSAAVDDEVLARTASEVRVDSAPAHMERLAS